jgi:predicted ATPase
MLDELRIINFKNFGDATLKLGPFAVIVGANASGKSNIRDAFRFLHGIGRGYTLADIIGGRYGAGGQVEWAQLRGSAREIVKFGSTGFRLEVSLTIERRPIHYEIEVQTDAASRAGFRVTCEELRRSSYTKIFTSHPGGGDPVERQDDENHLLLRMDKTGDQRKYGERILVRPDQPALTQISGFPRVARGHKELARLVMQAFADMRFLDLVPEFMRKPAFPGQAILGDSGENLPTVLQEICSDPKRKAVLTEWVRELTPMDVADFEFPRDQITGLVQLVFRERNGDKVSAYSASDGTLRFLAMLAALLGQTPAALYFFEEIDNGIHPSRLRLLIDLIEQQTAKGGIQVVTTTHSPDLLSMMSDSTFETTSVVSRLPDSSDAIIRLVKDLPKAAELRKSQGLGRLHASGWMEDAVAFTAPEDGRAVAS